MSVRISIPMFLQSFAGEKDVVETKGRNVGECLDDLGAQYPDMKKLLFDAKGKLHSYVGIYVNGQDAFPEELAKPVSDGDLVHILYMIAGG